MESRSSKAVKNFFDVLLDEPTKGVDIESQPLAKLLEKVGDIAPGIHVEPELVDPALFTEVKEPIFTEPEVAVPVEIIEPEIVHNKPELDIELQTEVAALENPLLTNLLSTELEAGFPVLFFEAMGETYSVPLVKLKGIYKKKSLSKLIGKPDWFNGVQIERDQRLNVIDTALYLMPEKYSRLVEYSPNYQYIIVIGESNWGLQCNRLIDSITLSHDDIKWRTDVTRSPWLAGTVKQRMCGLLAVDALIELFESNETK